MKARRVATTITAALGAAAVAFSPVTANAAPENTAPAATVQTTGQPTQGVDPDTRAGFHSSRADGCTWSVFVVVWPTLGVYRLDNDGWNLVGSYGGGVEFAAANGHTHDGWTYLDAEEQNRVHDRGAKYEYCM